MPFHYVEICDLLTVSTTDKSPLQSVILTLYLIRQPCPVFPSDTSLSPSRSHLIIVLPLFNLLSSVLTFLSCCGSRSQCNGAAVPGSPCVCLSAQFLLHGSPPSPALCLFIAQLSLFSLHCILGKKEEEWTEREGE